MRVLVLSKRQYTGRDAIDDRYGRVFEVPAALARLGHAVRGVSLSYRRRIQGVYQWADVPELTWESFNIGRLGSGLPRYLAAVRAEMRSFNPDVCWVTSDALHCILGAAICKSANIPFVLDFYDNYESFAASKVPGLVLGLRIASRCANGITVVSSTLAEYIAQNYRTGRLPFVLGNAIDPTVFRRMDRESVREGLSLPLSAPLVGVVGALHQSRGIEQVFRAFQKMAESDSRICLVIAGPRDDAVAIPDHPRVLDLGILPHANVPALLSALDVAIISNIDSDFGRYCFPQKLFEAIACGVPVVAAGVGEVGRLLRDYPASIYDPDERGIGLIKCLSTALSDPRPIDLTPPTWQQRGAQLESVLQAVVEEG